MKSECTKLSTDKILTFTENRSKLTLVNIDKAKITKVRVDGCQITSGIRCDYLVIAKNIEHYIELKGQDISHAIEQLIATIKELSLDIVKQQKSSYVICTRSPLTSASIQNLQIKFRKQFNSKLIIKSSPLEVTI